MPNLADGSAIPMAEISQDLQILPLQVKLIFNPDLQLRGLPGTLAPADSGHLEIALGGRDSPRSGSRQRKALDILPLQRASRANALGHGGGWSAHGVVGGEEGR